MKTTIQNRKEQNVVVLVESVENQEGLAFVAHGLGGFKEQYHISKMAEVFRNNNFTVVRFDTTNSLGESGGDYQDATITNYYEDLEDVIEWSASQGWYEEPFWMAGHSLGGISIALFAQKYQEKVKALAPISTVVSGKLSAESPKHKEIEKEWKEKGWMEEMSKSKPGVVKRLKWSHMEDRMKYDLLLHADRLTMPVLLAVGSEDQGTPEAHQRLLFNALPGKKELSVVDGAGHNFRKPEYLDQLGEIMDQWIKSL